MYHATCSRHNTDHKKSAFAAAAETDLKRLKDEDKNTMQSTVTWINQFETWQKVLLRIVNKLENIPVNDSDKILQYFFAEIQKCDGTEYKPECVQVVISVMDWYLREEGSS